MEKRKFSLWFSKRQAAKGKTFYVPSGKGKKMLLCTAITRERKPPTESSEYLTAKYFKVT